MININSVASGCFVSFILLLLVGMGGAAVRRSENDDTDVQMASLSSTRRWNEFKVRERGCLFLS
jgi:hypothetical protein